jgi:hypothetical protein
LVTSSLTSSLSVAIVVASTTGSIGPRARRASAIAAGSRGRRVVTSAGMGIS